MDIEIRRASDEDSEAISELLGELGYRTAAHSFYEHLGFPQTGRRFAKQIEPIPDRP